MNLTLPEKLIVTQQFYRTKMFITAFTTAPACLLSQKFQTTPSKILN
jgi:hypothetical protein